MEPDKMELDQMETDEMDLDEMESTEIERFTIENDHIKNYTILITDWNKGALDRMFVPLVIPFDENQRVSALLEELRQQLFVKAPTLCMTGELHFQSIHEPSLDNEAFLKDFIPSPGQQILHTNCYRIKQSPDGHTNSADNLLDGMNIESSAGTGEDLPTFLASQKAFETLPKAPDEVIMFAIDTSESMRWPAISGISDKYDADIWLGQDQEAAARRLLNCQKGHIRPEKAITSMPVQELAGALFNKESREDVVAILQLQSGTDRRARASSILEFLLLLYTRERRHFEQLIIKASKAPEQLEDNDNRSRYVRLTQITMGLVEHDSDLVQGLCDLPDREFEESKWRWVFSDGIPGTSGNQLPTTPRSEDRILIKVYHGRNHKHLFSYWTDRNQDYQYTSVILRYWRYMTEERAKDFDQDVDIWTEIRYVGDGRCVGKLNSHWDNIPRDRAAHGMGILGSEKLYLKPGEPSPDDSHPHIMVLKMHVESHGYQQRMDYAEAKRTESPSRLLMSQTFLDTFLDRALAYSVNCHIGVISFDGSTNLEHDVTHEIQDLYGSVNLAEPGGDTRIIKALSLASYYVTRYASRYPTARKRIICLSDCLGSSPRSDSDKLVEEFVKYEVVVDSVSFWQNNSALQAITWLTGGDRFVPKDNDEVLAIAQLESFLSQLWREPPPQPREGTISSFLNTRKTGELKSIRATADKHPLRPLHPLIRPKQSFVLPIKGLVNHNRTSTTDRSLLDIAQPGPATTSHNRNVRLRAELRTLQETRHKLYRVTVCEEDISIWQVVIDGNSEGALLYRHGVWVFSLHMTPNYPSCPPDVRFRRPIHHLNVNLDGRICHRLWYQDWTPSVSNLEIIEAVQRLLIQPRLDDAINLTAVRQIYRTGLFHCAFENEVERQIQKHARRSKVLWMNALRNGQDKVPEEGPNRKYWDNRKADGLRLAKIVDADVDELEYEARWNYLFPVLQTDEVVRYDVKRERYF